MLKVGTLCTPCLILDGRASGNLRELLSNFADILERDYEYLDEMCGVRNGRKKKRMMEAEKPSLMHDRSFRGYFNK